MNDFLDETTTITHELTTHNYSLSQFLELREKHPTGKYIQVTPTTVYFGMELKSGELTTILTWFLKPSQVGTWERFNEWDGRKAWDENNKEEEE